MLSCYAWTCGQTREIDHLSRSAGPRSELALQVIDLANHSRAELAIRSGLTLGGDFQRNPICAVEVRAENRKIEHNERSEIAFSKIRHDGHQKVSGAFEKQCSSGSTHILNNQYVMIKAVEVKRSSVGRDRWTLVP